MANATSNATVYEILYDMHGAILTISRHRELEFIFVVSALILGFIALTILIRKQLKEMYQLINEKLEGKIPEYKLLDTAIENKQQELKGKTEDPKNKEPKPKKKKPKSILDKVKKKLEKGKTNGNDT